MFSCTWILYGESVRIGVSLLPLESLVKEIGGQTVEVRSLQREGDSCSVFEPRPSSIAWLSEAQTFFRIGAGYESVIMDKLHSQFPRMEIIDLRESVEVVAHEGHEGHNHAHDHAHEHGDDCDSCSIEEGDPHIWLDPVRLSLLVSKVEQELCKLQPEHAKMYIEASARYRSELMDIHHRLTNQLSEDVGKAFYIYHPALGYFADRYGIEQIAIAESNQGPSVKHLQSIISQARQSGIRTIFVQPQESRRQAEIVASSIGANVVEIDPMSTDLIPNLERIGEALVRSFKQD